MRHRKDSRRIKRAENPDFLGYAIAGDDELAIEKDKARRLRNTPWWTRKRASGKCFYCGAIYAPNELTMDHIIPISRGGKSEKHNLVPACKDCNNKKKYLLPSEWEEHLQRMNKV